MADPEPMPDVAHANCHALYHMDDGMIGSLLIVQGVCRVKLVHSADLAFTLARLLAVLADQPAGNLPAFYPGGDVDDVARLGQQRFLLLLGSITLSWSLTRGVAAGR
jgi:hypothetical protein